MNCPKCNAKTRVTDSARGVDKHGSFVIRNRICKDCGTKFTTCEAISRSGIIIRCDANPNESTSSRYREAIRG